MIIKKLVWDEWNIAHIARHNVEQEEVKEVCSSRNLFERGRYLNIVVVPREKGFYPVTARDADDKERRRFKKKS